MRTNDRGRPDQERPQSVTVGDKSMVAAPNDSMAARPARSVVTYAEHFARRVLLDAINEATADYWRRRAEALRGARHRVGDYLPPGRLQAARARWAELTAIADACEAKADFIATYGAELFAAEVAAVMTEGVA